MNGHQKQREQSAAMIEEALFALLEEKEYETITVSEIAARADVGRRTFYRLYSGRDDVLRRYFDRLSEEYTVTYPTLNGYDFAQIAKDYFGFWHRYREPLLLLHRRGLDDRLYYEISRSARRVVSARRYGYEKQNETLNEELSFLADYSTGGFILLLHRWIACGMEGSPEAYAARVGEMFRKYIR